MVLNLGGAGISAKIMFATEPKPPMSWASFSASFDRKPAISRAHRRETSSISLLLAIALASDFSTRKVSAMRSFCKSLCSCSLS